MGETSYVQESFTGGEWSATAQGRFSDPRYRSAMNYCLNGIPIEAGAWTRRPGTRFASITRNGSAARPIKFDFKDAEPYICSFSDGFLRFYKGASVVMTNDARVVVSISSANPAVIETDAAHGWATGEQVMLDTLGTQCPLLQQRQLTITVVDTTHFSIADSLIGDAIDGATLGTYTSGANVARILELTTTYPTSALDDIRSIQAVTLDGPLSVLVDGTAPQVLRATTLPTDTTFGEFTLEAANFIDGPYLDPPTNGALVSPSTQNGLVSLTLSFYQYDATRAYSTGDFVTYGGINYRSLVDQNLNSTPSALVKWEEASAGLAVGPNGFTASDIGRHIRLFSETASPPDRFATPDPNGQWSWGKIVSLSNLIDPNLPGPGLFGDLTDYGGLASAFDGILTRAAAADAAKYLQFADFVANYQVTSLIGKSYTTPQKIGYATIYPSSDLGFGNFIELTEGRFDVGINTTRLTLYASHTLPGSATDGTALGLVQFLGNSTIPVTITSNDQTTEWEYVWFTIDLISNFFTPTPHFLSWNTTTAIAECQFFSPPGTSNGNAITVQILGAGLKFNSQIRTWRLGAFSNALGWPTCGTFHEGRLWLAGSIGNRFDASVANDIFNFAPTSAAGVVADNNAISYTFNAKDINAILWMEPDQQGIICGTKAGEWLIQASAQNNILTPTSIQAHRVTKIGCANIEPARTEHTLVIVQRYLRKLVEYFADVFSGKFTAPNLSEKAKHLTVGDIKEIAYQQELSPVIWARRGDGVLLGTTYKRDTLMTSQGPTIVGCHQHTLGSGHQVERICIGQSENGTLDSITMITRDPTKLFRQIEIMTDLPDEDATVEDAWYLDGAIIPSSTETSTVDGIPSFILHGLWYLNGDTVTVFANGLDCGDWPVTNGSCTVPLGQDPAGLFTSAFVDAFTSDTKIMAGYTYTSRGQMVRPATQVESGARAGPGFGKVRRSHHLSALLKNTAGISFGTVFGKLNKANFQTVGGTPYAANELFSGTHYTPLTDDYSFDSMIAWESTRPYPATVVAIAGFVETQDK